MNRKEKQIENHEKYESRVATFGIFKLAMILAGSVLLALVIGLVIGLFVLGGKKQKKADLTTEMIQSKIETVSELTTAEMNYRGIVRFSDGEIPLINRAHVNTIYEAKVRVGIDMSKIKTEVTEEQVIVTLPSSAVQGEVNVLPDSLQFYDEQESLFNQIDPEDVQQILIKAQEDAQLHANVEGIRETADAHARELVRALLSQEIIGERELVIRGE
ncbi:MAG: DUF4230 domain-containing protein [Lachnospiraceae bacterium]|nr:DUF4230 domain-containing protein [Lachnospiraceae bacterium]